MPSIAQFRHDSTKFDKMKNKKAFSQFTFCKNAFCVIFYYNTNKTVPMVNNPKPIPERRFNRSFKTKDENAMVTKMLSLSIGTTTLANPSCKAR